MNIYGISGRFRIEIEAESEDKALEKLDEIKLIDVNRLDIEDVIEY